MATLEQERAKFALSRIDGIGDGDRRAKLKTQLLKLPARLHTSGLGQTVAFYLANGPSSPEKEICDWLETWLQEVEIYGDGKLIRWITGAVDELDPEEAETRYRRASAEARALAVWLKRFAEAFVEEKAS